MSTPWPLGKNRKGHKNTHNYYKKERKSVDLKGTWLLNYHFMVVIVKRSMYFLRLSGKPWYFKREKKKERCFLGAIRKNEVLQKKGRTTKCLVSSIASLLGHIGFTVILHNFIYEARSNNIIDWQ